MSSLAGDIDADDDMDEFVDMIPAAAAAAPIPQAPSPDVITDDEPIGEAPLVPKEPARQTRRREREDDADLVMVEPVAPPPPKPAEVAHKGRGKNRDAAAVRIRQLENNLAEMRGTITGMMGTRTQAPQEVAVPPGIDVSGDIADGIQKNIAFFFDQQKQTDGSAAQQRQLEDFTVAYNSSLEEIRAEHADAEDTVDEFHERARTDPGLRARALRSPDPAHFMYRNQTAYNKRIDGGDVAEQLAAAQAEIAALKAGTVPIAPPAAHPATTRSPTRTRGASQGTNTKLPVVKNSSETFEDTFDKVGFYLGQ